MRDSWFQWCLVVRIRVMHFTGVVCLKYAHNCPPSRRYRFRFVCLFHQKRRPKGWGMMCPPTYIYMECRW